MQRILCLTLAITLSGCVIPQRQVLRPGASGKVVDARTHRPVAGALVTVAAPPHPVPTMLATKEFASIQSQTDGSFRAPAYTTVRPYLIISEMALSRSPLTIEKAGYAPYHGQVSTSTLGDDRSAVKDVGTLMLEPKAR